MYLFSKNINILYIEGHKTNPTTITYCQWIRSSCLYYNKYNIMLVSKLIYYYDEKNNLPNVHHVKIMGYSLSRLEVNALIHDFFKNLLKLK